MNDINWWTYQAPHKQAGRTPFEVARGRVHYWLASYPRLLMAVKLGCSLGPGDDGGNDITDMRRWERNVTTKADLDMALKHCTERQQEAVMARFHSGLSEREAAKKLGCSQPTLHEHCHKAIDVMAESLSGEPIKTGG